MSSIRMRLDNLTEKEAIDIFNKYKSENHDNIVHTLKQLAADGYDNNYFMKSFLSYLGFLNFFKIDLLDFESAGWIKWSFVDIQKDENFPEESLKFIREQFKLPL